MYNMQFKGHDFDTAFYHASSILQSNQTPAVTTRGSKVKEIINASITVDDSRMCVLTNQYRKLSLTYLQDEFDWYLSGDLSTKDIGEKASMWKKIADEDGNVNSNYGYFAFYQDVPAKSCKNQFEWVVNSLTEDINTRQAMINFNQVDHKYDGNKDFVCTQTMQFFIRDNRLHAVVNMRSCDLIYGAGYDIPFFAFLQQQVLRYVASTHQGITLGKLIHNSGSLHIYSRHFTMATNVSNQNPTTRTRSKMLQDVIDYKGAEKTVDNIMGRA